METLVLPDSRVCRKCGVEWPITEFVRHSHGAQGREHQCRTCCVKRVREWRQKRRADDAAGFTVPHRIAISGDVAAELQRRCGSRAEVLATCEAALRQYLGVTP